MAYEINKDRVLGKLEPVVQEQLRPYIANLKDYKLTGCSEGFCTFELGGNLGEDKSFRDMVSIDTKGKVFFSRSFFDERPEPNLPLGLEFARSFIGKRSEPGLRHSFDTSAAAGAVIGWAVYACDKIKYSQNLYAEYEKFQVGKGFISFDPNKDRSIVFFISASLICEDPMRTICLPKEDVCRGRSSCPSDVENVKPQLPFERKSYSAEDYGARTALQTIRISSRAKIWSDW